MNQLKQYRSVFDEIAPWEGRIPKGFIVDFLGTLTSKDFLVWGHNPAYADGELMRVAPPKIGDPGSDFWFEVVDWLVAVRRARGRFVMITLGALFGYQAVACCRALQRLNPMPYQLVAVEIGR